MKLSDIQIKDNPDEKYPDIDLRLLVRKNIKRIRGSIVDPFGTVPIFRIREIEFEDGKRLAVEGEHDVAYIATGDYKDFPVLSEDSMMNLWCEENPDECTDDLEPEMYMGHNAIDDDIDDLETKANE